ncbi:MAG: YdcF family protein [Acutalibacteraceae bacterium]
MKKRQKKVSKKVYCTSFWKRYYLLAESTNTLENMKFSKELIGDNDAKVAFSTTNYHVFRSGIFSNQAKLKAEGIGSKTKWYFWPNAFIREFIGLIVSQNKKIILLAVLAALISAALALWMM